MSQGLDLGWPITGEQHPDAIYLPRLLSLGYYRGGNEADARPDHEYASIHLLHDAPYLIHDTATFNVYPFVNGATWLRTL